MKDTYTVYTYGDDHKVQKLRTIKSYIKYRTRIRIQAEIRFVRSLWNDRAGIMAELKSNDQQTALN